MRPGFLVLLLLCGGVVWLSYRHWERGDQSEEITAAAEARLKADDAVDKTPAPSAPESPPPTQ